MAKVRFGEIFFVHVKIDMSCSANINLINQTLTSIIRSLLNSVHINQIEHIQIKRKLNSLG